MNCRRNRSQGGASEDQELATTIGRDTISMMHRQHLHVKKTPSNGVFSSRNRHTLDSPLVSFSQSPAQVSVSLSLSIFECNVQRACPRHVISLPSFPWPFAALAAGALANCGLSLRLSRLCLLSARWWSSLTCVRTVIPCPSDARVVLCE